MSLLTRPYTSLSLFVSVESFVKERNGTGRILWRMMGEFVCCFPWACSDRAHRCVKGSGFVTVSHEQLLHQRTRRRPVSLSLPPLPAPASVR
jgi:hypothetical protein